MKPLKSKDIIENAVLCDWLTLTSFLDQAGSDWARESKQGTFSTQKRLQYEGLVNEYSFFHGTAWQAGRTHHMAQCSGAYADPYLHKLACYGYGHCRRLDLQMTVYDTERLDAVRVRDVYEGRHAVTIISSPSGDTVYLGSRDSQRMVRIYQKAANLIRVELELKGDRAGQAWQELVDGQNTHEGWSRELAALYLGELIGFNHWKYDEPSGETFAPWFWQKVLDEAKHLSQGDTTGIEVRRTEHNTTKWLIQQVEPTIRKLIHSHDFEEYEWIKGWLAELQMYADSIG